MMVIGLSSRSCRKAWCVCYITPQICHKEIHARFTEAELARHFNTPEAIRADPRMDRFLAWIAKRPPEFLSRVPKRRS